MRRSPQNRGNQMMGKAPHINILSSEYSFPFEHLYVTYDKFSSVNPRSQRSRGSSGPAPSKLTQYRILQKLSWPSRNILHVQFSTSSYRSLAGAMSRSESFYSRGNELLDQRKYEKALPYFYRAIVSNFVPTFQPSLFTSRSPNFPPAIYRI